MPVRCSRARFALVMLMLSLLGALSACARAQEPAGSAANPPDCVEDYDAATDYFPDKASFDHATGVSVTYSNNTKLVEITRPWKDADEAFSVLLVQCGTPVPGDVAADMTIEVPIRRAATFSTTQLPSFALVDQVDAIVAHGGLRYVATPEVVDAVAAGVILEVGDQTEPDLEALVAARPDVALVSAGIDGDGHRRAIDAAGVPTVPYGDWLEETLLGRAEWLKVVALLTNTERRATQEFADIEQAVHDTIDRASEMTTRPKVLVGAPYEGTWFVPAGDSYVAAALTALGASYPWADTDGTGALPVDIEIVLDKAADADIWIGAGSFRGTVEDLIAADERFQVIRALRSGEVYAEDRVVSEAGGNLLFELGAARPDLVVADLFKILYPAQAEDVEFTFHGRVGAGGRR